MVEVDLRVVEADPRVVAVDLQVVEADPRAVVVDLQVVEADPRAVEVDSRAVVLAAIVEVYQILLLAGKLVGRWQVLAGSPFPHFHFLIHCVNSKRKVVFLFPILLHRQLQIWSPHLVWVQTAG